jgi:hypothetical protein
MVLASSGGRAGDDRVEARVALLTIRRLSAQPRNHRYVDRVALGEPHAQVDHLFRALVIRDLATDPRKRGVFAQN